MKKLFFLAVIVAFVSCNSGTKNTGSEPANPTVEPEMVETTLNIGGMHCDMCVASIFKGINELEGVSAVAVSLSDSSAVVSYDVSKLDLSEIEKAIEKRGYSIKK